MSDVGLGILEGLAQGTEKATANLFNIMIKKHEIETQTAKNEIEAKKAKLELQKLEYETDPATLALKTQETESKIKAQKALDQMRLVTVKQKEIQLRDTVRQHKQAMDFFDTVINDPSKRDRIGVSADGKLTYRPPSGTAAGPGFAPSNIYSVAEKMAKEKKIAGGDYSGQVTQADIQAEFANARNMLSSARGTPEQTAATGYTADQEAMIADNMKAYGKTRDEVVNALKRKGHL
jgi:hypothetical protein